jgi:hypothetical protein
VLETQTRTLFGEALHPPEDYRLDRVVGTTYTLDLAAMLIVPLAMTFSERDPTAKPDPLALLESVRRQASCITVFCQEDRIAVPRAQQPLFAYLEQCVLPVRPPDQGSFHPKVWVLRFTAAGRPVKYRLLVLSRNLTFDHSWDTVLVLEGEVMNRTNGYSSNRPLAEFFAALPGMAPTRPSADRVETLELMSQELRKVRFTPPDGVQSLEFLPMMPRRQSNWPFESVRVDRMLVISRFLSDGCLARLSSRGRGNILVSDFSTLAEIRREALAGYQHVAVLSDAAEPDPGTEEQLEATEDAPAEEAPSLSGLHAKVYVADSGGDGYVWTGSANATEAAFRNNVEFMVRLAGSKSRCGVEAVLGKEESPQSLAYLLRPYLADSVSLPDAVEKALEAQLEAARRSIADAGLELEATELAKDRYRVALNLVAGSSFQLPAGVKGQCRPITLAGSLPVASSATGPATILEFDNLTLQALTTFIAFDLTAAAEGRSLRTSFTLKLPLSGTPDDRAERLLTAILADKDSVQRYLLLLLSEAASTPGEVASLARALGEGGWSGSESDFLSLPVFEMMLRALRSSPESLDRVAELITALSGTIEGRALLPTGFQDVWQPLWLVRQEVADAAQS